MKPVTKDLKPLVGMVIEMRPYLNWGGLYTIIGVNEEFDNLVFVVDHETAELSYFYWGSMVNAGAIVCYEENTAHDCLEHLDPYGVCDICGAIKEI